MAPSLLRRFEARRLDAPRRPTRFEPHYDPEAFGRLSEGVARFFGTANPLQHLAPSWNVAPTNGCAGVRRIKNRPDSSIVRWILPSPKTLRAFF